MNKPIYVGGAFLLFIVAMIVLNNSNKKGIS